MLSRLSILIGFVFLLIRFATVNVAFANKITVSTASQLEVAQEALTTLPASRPLWGSACLRYKNEIAQKGIERFADCSPSARSLFAMNHHELGQACLVDKLSPFYIRSPVA